MFFSTLILGTKLMPLQFSETFSRFNVGGITQSFIDKIEKIASIEPDAPKRCPVDDLVEDIKSCLD